MRYRIIDNGFCFICGKRNPAGLQLTFEETEKGVSATFILERQYQGYEEIIHGGVIAAILDEAMIKAANLRGLNAITAEITIRFRNTLMVGQNAMVQGKVLKEERRIIRAQAIIYKDDLVIAEAEGKLYVPVV